MGCQMENEEFEDDDVYGAVCPDCGADELEFHYAGGSEFLLCGACGWNNDPLRNEFG